MKKPVKTLYNLEEQLSKWPQSNFGSIRKHDIHTGLDLYCTEGEDVFSIEDGVIISMEIFTGKEISMPWWNTTFSVVVRGSSGYIVYGEITINNCLKVGSIISEGTLLGKVSQVLKEDKGKNPLSMLHVELYSELPHSVIWNKNTDKPSNLKNPYDLLKGLYK